MLRLKGWHYSPGWIWIVAPSVLTNEVLPCWQKLCSLLQQLLQATVVNEGLEWRWNCKVWGRPASSGSNWPRQNSDTPPNWMEPSGKKKTNIWGQINCDPPATAFQESSVKRAYPRRNTTLAKHLLVILMTSSRMRRSPSSIWPSVRRMGFMVSINSVCINQTQIFVPRKWKTQVLHSCTTAVPRTGRTSPLTLLTELLVFSLLHHATSLQPMFLAHVPPKNLSSIRNLDPIGGPWRALWPGRRVLYCACTSPQPLPVLQRTWLWPCLNMS